MDNREIFESLNGDFYPHTLGDELIPVPLFVRIIGVADLMHGAYIKTANRLYVSMREAIHREIVLHENVELHFEQDEYDTLLLAQRKAAFLAQIDPVSGNQNVAEKGGLK